MSPQQPMSRDTPPTFIPAVPVTPRHPAPTGPPEAPKRPWFVAAAWFLFGLCTTFAGTIAAMAETADAVDTGVSDSTAALGIFLTAPFGALAGAILAVGIAAITERRRPSPAGRRTRRALAFYGCLLPLLPILSIGLFFWATIIAS